MNVRMIENRTVVCVLSNASVSLGHTLCRPVVSLLVAKQRCSHATHDDVDGDTKGDKEARSNGTHAS